MAQISKETKSLIAKYQLWQKLQSSKEAPTIHVDEVAQKVAAFYERIRTIVDWKEEHLMRRAAVIRKLKRRFLDLELNNFSASPLAESLVLELIRGGYFQNDKIEESKIITVQKIIDKYVFILKHNPKNSNQSTSTGLQFYDRVIEIASCEIEETLAPSIKEMALIDYMFELMIERIKISEKIYERNLLKPEDKNIQIYIAVQQALFKLDEPIISYNLIRYKFEQWNNPTEEELFKISQNIIGIISDIEKDLAHPLAKKFYRICEKYDTAYLLIGDILSTNNFEKIQQEIQEPALLEGHIRGAYIKRLNNLKEKIRRAAIYSTLSIFITKILSIIVFEYILTLLFQLDFKVTTLIINILIPTGLMAVLVLSIRPPSKRNINLVVVEIMKIFYEKEKSDTYEIKIAKQKGFVTTSFLALTYILGACISFGAIIWVFIYLQLDVPSIFINIIFIALILFAGTLVQKSAQELTIEETSGGFIMFLSDILFLPITGMGSWMSNKWKRYNIVIAFINALIDMPFAVFVEFLERWRYFIKEHKDDMR